MDWLLTNPQIHSTFSTLGSLKDDIYEMSPDALNILEEINLKLIYEDQTLRTFRRAIGFGQHVKTDLIPLLIQAKDPEIVDAVIRILVNLTVPVECLFCVDIMYRTEVGRCTIFELNKLLITSKEAFADSKSTKSVVDRIKSILESDTKKLSTSQCHSINNCLLLLRNILHIPETNLTGPHSSGGNNNGTNGGQTSLQNTILWNLFIQSIDKILIYLMSCSQRSHWGVTMVQLIALMYKDQHVSTLQKLLNNWFDASLSESSEDNESNTTPPNKCSGDSSPMLTSSDPTSDSSDNGGSGKTENSEDRRQNCLHKETEATLQEVSRKGHEYQNAIMRIPIKKDQKNISESQPAETSQIVNRKTVSSTPLPTVAEITSQPNTIKIKNTHPAEQQKHTSKEIFTPPQAKSKIDKMKTHSSPTKTQQAIKSPHSGVVFNGKCPPQKRECPSSNSELSDCGYGTQVENQESISTSSNEDDGPQKKPVHQKPPCNQKRSKQFGIVTPMEKKEWRRKKLVKRSKSNIINMKGLIQHSPTDEDISNILKEFTVDFLLKGYGYLVHELHAQLLEDLKFPMDTSHFFWLVTYFLKFASQLEVDLEHINTVLNYDVISYLTFEGVALCEQLELTSRQEGGDMKPFLRRIHLVVTAIREFLQALETYKKIAHLSQEDRQYLRSLQLQVCATEDLRSLFLLLTRKYNPAWHSRQYLQDLIVTNHLLLVLLDNVSKSDDKDLINFKMTDHIPQFAHLEIMYHYGLLLEDFRENGEFINDCIFTMMHHIGADLEQVHLLFQPVVLKTFSKIWESEFEVCDDWSDLIEYVIHKFMKTPQKNPFSASCGSLTELTKEHNKENNSCVWIQEEKDILYWYYVQSKKTNDLVGKIHQLYKDNGNRNKSRMSIIQQLLQQDVVTLVEYDDLLKLEDSEYERNYIKRKPSNTTTESGIDLNESSNSPNQSIEETTAFETVQPKRSITINDIQYLRTLLIKEDKAHILKWLQKVLLECCFVKLNIDFGKNSLQDIDDEEVGKIRVMESIPYHCILRKKSIPLVPWNTEQSIIMSHKPFVMLLHKLGFHLPTDAGTVYARIPEFWTADIMYNIAQKLGPVDKNLLKFDISLLHNVDQQHTDPTKISEDTKPVELESINELFSVPMKHSNSVIRFTPDPASTPSVPNWLQLVMKSKCNISSGTTGVAEIPTSVAMNAISGIDMSERMSEGDSTSTNVLNATAAALETIKTEAAFVMPSNSRKLTMLQQQSSEDDSLMKSLDENRDDSSGYQTRRGSQMDSEFSTIVTSVIDSDFLNNCTDTDSVSSDLTRMYVSDEDNQ